MKGVKNYNSLKNRNPRFVKYNRYNERKKIIRKQAAWKGYNMIKN